MIAQTLFHMDNGTVYPIVVLFPLVVVGLWALNNHNAGGSFCWLSHKSLHSRPGSVTRVHMYFMPRVFV